MSDDTQHDVDVRIVRSLYRVVDHAIDALLDGDQQRAIMSLRGMLPKDYKHTLIVDKHKD